MPKLSRKEEDLARKRAKKFGRPYPNPIDVNSIVRLKRAGLDNEKRGG